MRRLLISGVAFLAAVTAAPGLSAGAAWAAGTPPAPSPAPTTPAPSTAVAATVRLTLVGAFDVHGAAVTVPRRPIEVSGIVRPYVPGQSVQVQSSVNHRVFKTDVLRIKPAADGRSGAFTERVVSPRPGIVRVQVVHALTAQMLAFAAQRALAALPTHVGFGARGQLVDLVQQRLAALHVYVPQTGVYDQQTGLAIDAYHRLLHMGTAQTLNAKTLQNLLDGRGTFAVRYPGDGRHAEGDLGDQLLALIDGARVQEIFPISSGKPSTPTVQGRFRVYLRVPGYLPDGMYYSSFFTGNYAIHGYDPAPDYPASHGCMRLPIVDAITAYDWLSLGDPVDVYE